MGNKELEPRGNGIEEDKNSSYLILSFAGSQLPKEYQGLVMAKWLRTLKYGADFYKLIDKDAFYPVYSKFIERLLNKEDSVVRLAVLSEDRDVVLGYSLSAGPVLHYVWVQSDQRNQGIGTTLAPKTVEKITHVTNSGIKFWQKKFPNAKFDPFFT